LARTRIAGSRCRPPFKKGGRAIHSSAPWLLIAIVNGKLINKGRNAFVCANCEIRMIRGSFAVRGVYVLKFTVDIFSAIDVLLTIERDAAKTLRESKSYRIGRSITNTLRLLIPSDALWGLPSRAPHDMQNGVSSGG